MRYADVDRTFVIEEQVADVADLPMDLVNELLARGMFPEPVLTKPRVWRVKTVRKWRVRVLGAAIGRQPGKKRGPYGPRKAAAA